MWRHQLSHLWPFSFSSVFLHFLLFLTFLLLFLFLPFLRLSTIFLFTLFLFTLFINFLLNPRILLILLISF